MEIVSVGDPITQFLSPPVDRNSFSPSLVSPPPHEHTSLGGGGEEGGEGELLFGRKFDHPPNV